jgi:hypothetical protein
MRVVVGNWPWYCVRPKLFPAQEETPQAITTEHAQCEQSGVVLSEVVDNGRIPG